MHELAIAQAMLDVVERHAHGRRVTRIEVRVGALRQVVPGALAFAFDLVADGTVAQDADLLLAEVPVGARCRACGAESEPDTLPLTCAACGGWDLVITRGEELCVDLLECDEAQQPAPEGVR